MRKNVSTAYTAAKRHAGTVFGRNSFIIVVCAALALILGAMSVGAVVYVTKKPIATVAVQPTPGNTTATPPTRPAVQGAATTAEPAPEPPAAQPPTEINPEVPPTKYDAKKAGISWEVTKEDVQLHAQAPVLPDKGLTLTLPNPVQPILETLDKATKPIKDLLR